MRLRNTAESLLQDLFYAARMLRKNPGFAAAAILTLALGIGANTAIFGVVYATLLKPIGYQDPDRLVAIHVRALQFEATTPSMAARPHDYIEWRKENTVFSDLAIFRPAAINLTGDREPQRLGGVRISSNLLPLLGIAPERGRNFAAEEDRPGNGYSVILSHDFWVSQFGGDPEILNRKMELDGHAYRIVGILPAAFPFPTGKQFHPLMPIPPHIDIWVPIALTDAEIALRANFDYGVIGRLKPGVTIDQAHHQMDALALELGKRDFQGFRLDLLTNVIPMRNLFTSNVRSGLILLLAAAGLLLLIACVNLANLSMARMTSRRREFATRTALGAQRPRLVRQALTESALLAVLGGLAAIALANWGTQLLIALRPADLPMLDQVKLNVPVLLFTMAVALLTTILFGLLPAFESSRTDLRNDLKAGTRGATEGGRTGRMRQALVCAEVALSTALLVAAGLLLHSFVKVMNVDRGFAVERIVSVDLALPSTTYTSKAQQIAFFNALAPGLAGLPGVVAVGAINDLPLSNEAKNSLLHLESDTQPNLSRPVAADRSVTPGYFAAMGIPLRAGRLFRDDEPAMVTVISVSLAKALWPGEQPDRDVGKRLRQNGPQAPLVTVVGIVADVQTATLDRKPMPQIYRPFTQRPASEMSVVIRAAGDPATLGRAIRSEIWRVDKNLPVPSMKTMSEIVSASVAQRRFQMSLIITFALVALALTLVGIYGVVNYAVQCRTSEIGLRMALGAEERDVLKFILAKGLSPVLLGLALGAAGAVLAAGSLRSFLFGVGPLDPGALGGVVALLFLTSVVACYLPARRASHLDPTTALRQE